ncbi:MAG: hypothetical protein ACKOQ6_01555 [Bacteroidota bacterium]
MSKNTLGYCKNFLVQPATPQVDVINQSTFTKYAKAWAHRGFVPVLCKVGTYMYHVKLYFDATKIKDREELCMFTATYFREKFDELSSHSKCSQILIYATKWIDSQAISKANSLNDLEQSLLNILPDETPCKCNDQGEGAIKNLANIPCVFNHWNGLILDGFFEPEYEERCRLEEEKKKNNALGNTTVSLQLFMKTGGPQPGTWDAQAINKFFQGNLAKKWAMCDGYLPTYTGYENGQIQFELVTDPRCTGLNWINLCNHIANQYKEHVKLLKDATHFKAEHFIANDIIGFNINANDTDKFNKYNDRVEATYASLPLKPEETHYGKIR